LIGWVGQSDVEERGMECVNERAGSVRCLAIVAPSAAPVELHQEQTKLRTLRTKQKIQLLSINFLHIPSHPNEKISIKHARQVHKLLIERMVEFRWYKRECWCYNVRVLGISETFAPLLFLAMGSQSSQITAIPMHLTRPHSCCPSSNAYGSSACGRRRGRVRGGVADRTAIQPVRLHEHCSRT